MSRFVVLGCISVDNLVVNNLINHRLLYFETKWVIDHHVDTESRCYTLRTLYATHRSTWRDASQGVVDATEQALGKDQVRGERALVYPRFGKLVKTFSNVVEMRDNKQLGDWRIIDFGICSMEEDVEYRGFWVINWFYRLICCFFNRPNPPYIYRRVDLLPKVFSTFNQA